MVTSDSINNYSDARELLDRMISGRIELPFFVRCDVQVSQDPASIGQPARGRFPGPREDRIGFTGDAAARAQGAQPPGELRTAGAAARHRTDTASFYLPTPIPGTVQYEEFRAAGLITEPNLDRFDGINAWRHPNLSAGALERLVCASYRGLHGWGDIDRRALVRRDWGPARRGGHAAELAGNRAALEPGDLPQDRVDAALRGPEPGGAAPAEFP